MISQNQLQSSEEKMVDVFEAEELESRLEMCGGWFDPCPSPDGASPGGNDCVGTESESGCPPKLPSGTQPLLTD